MAEHSSFFNGPTYDAADFAAYFASFFKNGVFAKPADGLQARALHNDMRVTILPGVAFIDGYRYELDNSDAEFTLTVPTADGTLDRKDIIVIRRDLVNNNAKAYYIAGTPASNPSVPTLTHTSAINEIQLCSINVAHGAVKVSDSDITDTRFYNSVCGIVASAVTDINTSELFAQYNAMYQDFQTKVNNAFSAWFANVQNTLSGDVAGNLLNQINKKADTAALSPVATSGNYLDLKGIPNKYDVGDIYISTKSTSPASKYGGTWQALGGKFLFAAYSNPNSIYYGGKTGGSATKTILQDNLPNVGLYTHGYYSVDNNLDGSTVQVRARDYITNDPADWIGALGGGRKAMDIMPPYLCVYMWERIA